MIDFRSKIAQILPPKHQKYVTIVVPNGFSTFSKRYLENHDFDLILGPIFDDFWIILAHFGGSWRLRGPILGICRPTWSQLEPTWTNLTQHEASMSQHDPNISQHKANISQLGANISQHKANIDPKKNPTEGAHPLSRSLDLRKIVWGTSYNTADRTTRVRRRIKEAPPHSAGPGQ